MISFYIFTLSGVAFFIILNQFFNYLLYNSKGKKDLSKTADEYIIDVIKKKKLSFNPTLGIITGSGQNSLIKNFTTLHEIPFNSIPSFPHTENSGHDGKLILANYDNKDIIVMLGRSHFYEGYNTSKVTSSIKLMNNLGIQKIIFTNSSGSLNPKFNVGDIVVINDHVYLPGLAGFSPLVGERGKKFIAPNKAYNKDFRKKVLTIAKDSNLDYIREGVYCGVAGPCYETPAEVRMLMNFADVVGMSTIPEVIVARQCNIDVLVLALVTNKCINTIDDTSEPTHKEVCDNADNNIERLRYVVENFINE